MGKKCVFIFLLLVMSMLSFASAAEFDNIKTYNEDLKVVTITNAFGLGDVIGQARLTSDLNVKVPRGYQKVAEFDIWAYDDYNDAIKQFTFTDMKKKEKINRDYDLKKLSYEDVIINDYYSNCYLDYSNSTNGTQICEQILNGSHIEIKEVWTKITPADLKKNEVVTIGVFTEVQKDDFVDWIPVIYGVEIPEWATWTEDLNVGINLYYRFDEASGDAVDATGTQIDGTSTGITYGNSGIISDSFTFQDYSTDRVDANFIPSGNEFAISMWVYLTDSTTGRTWYMAGNDNVYDGVAVAFVGGGQFVIRKGNGISSQDIVTSNYILTNHTNEWVHIVATFSTTNMYIYVNGNLDNSAVKTLTPDWGTQNFLIGNSRGFNRGFAGRIDGVGIWARSLSESEALNIYNSGIDGNEYEISYGTAPSVTLTSPVDTANLTSATVDHIATVTDDERVEWVAFYLDGVLEQNSTSHVNGSYTFTETVAEGNHTWFILASDNSSSTNQSTNWTYDYTQPPIFIDLLSPADVSTHNTPTVNLSCRAYESEGVEQLNLTINGVVNITVTNSTPGENLSISQNINFNEGNYTWGCQAINPTTSAESSNRTFEVLYSNPVINLFSPENDSLISTQDINFIFNATDINGVDNVSLLIDGVFDQINTSGINGQYTLPKTFTEGIYNWSIVANSVFGKQTISETRIFNVTFSSPNVTLFAPEDESRLTNESVSFDFSATDSNGIDNISLYINDVLNETNSSGFNGTYIINKVLAEGFYNWSVVATSEFGKQTISAVNDFIVHITEPSVSVTAPNGTLGHLKLGDNETLNYLITEPGQNLSHFDECWYEYEDYTDYNDSWVGSGFPGNTSLSIPLNYSTVSEIIMDFTSQGGSNETYSNFNANCNNRENFEIEIETNGTGSYFYCIGAGDIRYFFTSFYGSVVGGPPTWFNIKTKRDLNCSATEANFTYITGVNSLTVFAKDTFGLIASDTTSWSYIFLEITQTYRNSTVEGSVEKFDLSLNSTSVVTGANFIYDGTSYSTQIFSLGDGEYNISSTIIIPDFPANTNATFYFQITFAGSQTLNSSENEQFVSVLLVDDCTNYSNLILNISLFDEKTLVSILGTIEANLLVLDSNGASTLSNVASTFYNKSNFEICSNINLSSGNLLYDLELKYYVDPDNTSNYLYVPEFYHIQKASVSNFPQSISLYDLNINESTEFIITYQNDNFVFIEDAVVQLQRKYIGEGIYRVVEAPITSDGGKAIVHIDLNLNKYRASIVKDGELLDVFEDIIFDCGNELSGECEEALEGDVSPNNNVPVTEILDFSYSVDTSETTNTIVVSFSIPSGSPTAVNVVLDQKDMFGNITTCNTTIIASAGSLTCTYSDTIEKSILELSISKGSEEVGIFSYMVDPKLDMDGINFFIVFLFLISLVGMAIASPEWIIIIAVMVILISGTLLLLNGMSLVIGVGAVIWLLISAVIIIMKMAKQEDR